MSNLHEITTAPSKDAVTHQLSLRSEAFCTRLGLTPRDEGWIKDPVNGTLSKKYTCEPSKQITDDELTAAKVASFGADSVAAISFETKEVFVTVPVVHFTPEGSSVFRKIFGWLVVGLALAVVVSGFLAVIKMRNK